MPTQLFVTNTLHVFLYIIIYMCVCPCLYASCIARQLNISHTILHIMMYIYNSIMVYVCLCCYVWFLFAITGVLPMGRWRAAAGGVQHKWCLVPEHSQQNMSYKWIMSCLDLHGNLGNLSIGCHHLPLGIRERTQSISELKNGQKHVPTFVCLSLLQFPPVVKSGGPCYTWRSRCLRW